MTAQPITPGMPEPKANSLYILHCCTDEAYIEKDATGYCDDGEHWYDTSAETSNWKHIRTDYDGYTIESLAEHDKRIRRDALTATDEELAVMEAAFDAAIEEREDDGIGAMGIAMKALAASRERES